MPLNRDYDDHVYCAGDRKMLKIFNVYLNSNFCSNMPEEILYCLPLQNG